MDADQTQQESRLQKSDFRFSIARRGQFCTAGLGWGNTAQGLKPFSSVAALRGPEGPLFHSYLFEITKSTVVA